MPRIRHTPPAPAVRSFPVTFPVGGTFADLVSDHGRLVYAAGGTIRIRTSDGEWLLPPEHAVWVPGGVQSKLELKGRVTLRTLYFRVDLSRRLWHQCRVIRLSALQRELVLFLSRRGDIATDAATTHATPLLIELLAATKSVPLELPLPKDSRLLRATEILSTREGTRRRLAQIGNDIGASTRTLERLFVDQTGLTFEQWRRRERLVRALALLSEGSSVTHAGFEAGYESTSAFIAMFRRELGATPRQYLNARRADAPHGRRDTDEGAP